MTHEKGIHYRQVLKKVRVKRKIIFALNQFSSNFAPQNSREDLVVQLAEHPALREGPGFFKI
jgi:hypothetical protein